MYKTTTCKWRNSLTSNIKAIAIALMMFASGFTWSQTTGTVQIGSGTATVSGGNAMPVTNYVYNYNQQIVSASEIAVGGGTAGDITAIRYHATALGGNPERWNELTIYIANTNKTSFDSNTDWVDFADLTEVYSGEITPVAGEWFEMELDTPFAYTGGNLVVAVYEEVSGWTSPVFLSYTSSSNTGILYRSDSANPDPNSPPTATSRVSNLPQIQFEMDLADCLPPTDLTIDDLTSDSATITWSEIDSASGYDYYYDTVNTAPTNTTPPTGNVSIASLELENLDPTTTYYLWLRSVCDDSESAWVQTSFITGCVTIDVPFQEGFNSGSTTEQCWTILNENEDADSWDLNYTSNPYEGDQVAMMYTDGNNGDNDDWLITPHINLDATTGAKRLRFWYRTQSTVESNDYRIMLSTTGSSPDDFTIELMPLTIVNNTTYEEKIINLLDEDGNPYTGEVYIAYHIPAGGLDGWRLYIDDVNIEDIPPCPDVMDLEVVSTTSNSAVIGWTPGFDETEWEIIIQDPADAAPSDTTTGDTTSDNPHTFEGLDPNTEYHIYVRPICDDGESNWVGPLSIQTACETFNVPFWEGFNSDSTTQQCWTVLNENGDGDAWTMDYATNPYEGDQVAAMYTDFNNGNNNDWLVSPHIDLTNPLGAARIKFHYRTQSVTEPNDFRIVVSTASGNPVDFTTEILPLTEVGTTDYQQMIVNIVDGSGDPIQDEVYIAFHVPNGGLDGWRLYIDNVFVEPYNADCPDPTDLVINQATQNSIEVGWTAEAGQDTWDVLALPAGSPIPDDTATGFETTSDNPYTIEGLDPATEYDIYVRADCGGDGLSYWAGPISATTTQIPAPVDFFDDFEGETGWTFTNGDQTNEWHIGTATAFAGTTSMYISNDDGASNAYSNVQTYTHAIRDLSFPADANEAVISFYWKAQGHINSFGDNYDMLKVWLMPSNYQPEPGIPITADDGGIAIGTEFLEENDWVFFQDVYNVNAYADGVGRLIFEWRNNTFTNNTPPAAIDDVSVTLVTCSRPIEVTVEKNQVTGDLIASWTPVNGETQWEVIVLPADDPAPTDADTGVIVDDPFYVIPDVVNGELYKIYVRALCDEDDFSLWTEGVDFSDFSPPACADVNIDFPDLVMDDFGDFIFCAADGELTLDLNADFDDSMFKGTSSYDVEEIDYEPPFPFIGGTVMPITSDDDYTASFDLPFNFCFYGESYSYCRIGDNGVVTFGMPYTTTYGDFCPYSLNGTIPNTNFNMKNSILGIYHDMHTTNNPGENTQINYQILGTYPCRALVVNFNEVPTFSSSCSDEQYRTTTQIVLYEITNIIEVYVKQRTPCTNSTSGGQGVLGLINADGSQAITPPGRNTGTWSATEEAWRFSPSAPTTVEFGWYINGDFYSNNPNDQITVTKDTCVEARVTYPGCGGEDLVLSKEYCVKVAPEINLDEPLDVKVCLEDGVYDPLNLGEKIPEAIKTLMEGENFDIADYEFTFYHSEADATAKTGNITNPDSYVPNPNENIWIRVEHISTACFGVIDFRIYEGENFNLNTPDDIILCVYNDVIPEADLSVVNDEMLANISTDEELIIEYFNTENDAIFGTDAIPDWDSFVAPSLPHQIWVKVSGSAEICETITSFILTEGIGFPAYEHPDFDICTGYVLPTLPAGYFYTTETLAEGDRIEPGTILRTPGINTVHVNIVSDEGCITSSSYDVNIIDCTPQRGISPNGDGLNDNLDLTDYFLLELKIFNRHGVEVYSHGAGYTNQWEGQSNGGNMLPEGTYYYHITTHVEQLTGWIQLARETR